MTLLMPTKYIQTCGPVLQNTMCRLNEFVEKAGAEHTRKGSEPNSERKAETDTSHLLGVQIRTTKASDDASDVPELNSTR